MAQDILSHVTGRTAGEAQVLGDATVDMGALFNAINDKKALAEEQYKNVKATVGELKDLKYAAWSEDQSLIDSELNKYRADYVKALDQNFKATGSATLDYNQQREFAKRRDEIAGKARLSLEDAQIFDDVTGKIASNFKDLDMPVTKQLIYDYAKTPLGQRNRLNVTKYKEQVQEETKYTYSHIPTELEYTTISKSNKVDGVTNSSTRQEEDVDATLNNFYSKEPKQVKNPDNSITIQDNKRILDEYAKSIGLNGYQELQGDNKKKALEYLRSNGYLVIKGKKEGDVYAENEKSNGFNMYFGGGGVPKQYDPALNPLDKVGLMYKIDDNTKGSMFVLGKLNTVPVTMNITSEQDRPFLDFSNGKKINSSRGITNAQVLNSVYYPTIATDAYNKLIKSDVYSKLSEEQKAAISRIRKDIPSKDDYQVVKQALGADTQNYIALVEGYQVREVKGSGVNMVETDFIIPSTNNFESAYKQALMKGYKITEKEAEAIIKYNKSAYKYAVNEEKATWGVKPQSTQQGKGGKKYKNNRGEEISEEQYNKLSTIAKGTYKQI